MAERFKKFVDILAKYSFLTMIVSLSIEVLILTVFFVTKSSNLILSIIGIGFPIITYYLINSFVEEEKPLNFLFLLFKLSLLMSVLIIVNTIIFSLIPSTFTTPMGNTSNSPLAIICLVVDIIIVIFLGYSIGQDSMLPFFDSIKTINIWTLLKIELFMPKVADGDIVLCRALDTNKQITIPYTDRFLHMLVLGPTGCGKTSQIIIPMINQDMQNSKAGITVLEPKGDLADKIYAMAQYYGRKALYFDPILAGCPTFNPLYGKEEDVIENVVTTFKMLDPDSPQYFKDMNEQLLRNSLKVLKRLKKNTATMIDLSTLVSNTAGDGRKMVNSFLKIPSDTASIAKENADIANYFLSDYLAEKSKTYENTSGVRSQISKIVSNKYLRKVLNPENGKSDIDFDKHLEEGGVICISTAQGKLRELGSFLGYFIILNFQSAVFKRPGTEFTRNPHFLYIDEFQTYSNPGFSDMLTQGRSYRVASHLATQNRALIGMGAGKEGKNFIELVSTNARNVVIFPGGNSVDAKYYSDQFGEITEIKQQKGVTRQKFNPLFFQQLSPPSESIRVSEEIIPRFSPSDIIYRKFTEITYATIRDNSVDTPGVGIVNYIPKELNSNLNTMIEENKKLLTLGWNANECRDFERNGKLDERIDMEEVDRLYKEFEFKEKNYDIEAAPVASPLDPQQSTSQQPTAPSSPQSPTTPYSPGQDSEIKGIIETTGPITQNVTSASKIVVEDIDMEDDELM